MAQRMSPHDLKSSQVWTKRIKGWLGLVALVVGILLTLGTISFNITQQRYISRLSTQADIQLRNVRTQMLRDSLELERLRLELYSHQRDAQPQFRAWYITVSLSLFGSMLATGPGHPEHPVQPPAIGYPILENDIFRAATLILEQSRHAERGGAAYGRMGEVTLLVIEAVGKALAEDLSLAVRAHEMASGRGHISTDYVLDSFDGHADLFVRSEVKHLALGELDTGMGLLVPLFVASIFLPGAETVPGAMVGLQPLRVQFTYGGGVFDGRFDIRASLSDPIRFDESIRARG